ncbi:MAG: patatin family protein, partial [Hyphomicrobiaceae bacterium]
MRTAAGNITGKATRLLVLATVGVVLVGCAAPMVRNGISSAELANRASIAGLPGVRFWGDEVPTNFRAELRRRLPHMPRLAQNADHKDGRPVVEILALSGGGSDGAFGAGLLTGWTERGDRPEFEVVTG